MLNELIFIYCYSSLIYHSKSLRNMIHKHPFTPVHKPEAETTLHGPSAQPLALTVQTCILPKDTVIFWLQKAGIKPVNSVAVASLEQQSQYSRNISFHSRVGAGCQPSKIREYHSTLVPCSPSTHARRSKYAFTRKM